MRLDREIRIEASPEALYDLVMDPSRLREWVTIHQALKSAPNGLLERGSQLVQRLHVAGTSFDVHWTVLEATRPDYVLWEGTGPWGSRASTTYTLRRQGEATVFGYSNEYRLPGGPFGEIASRVLSPASGREADLSLAQLKTLAEA